MQHVTSLLESVPGHALMRLFQPVQNISQASRETVWMSSIYSLSVMHCVIKYFTRMLIYCSQPCINSDMHEVV